jgi:hypothetical protein
MSRNADTIKLELAHAKYKAGDALSDQELLLLYKTMAKSVVLNTPLGPIFQLQVSYCRSVAQRCEQYIIARKLKLPKVAGYYC